MIRESRGLIILDRDGVLNSMVIHPDHGLVDSPLHPDQVEVFPWVPEALSLLNGLGYGLAIATNQPAAAKKKTTRENLEAVHRKILGISESKGAQILSSHICWHLSEDHCECRKPKPGLLLEAFQQNPEYDPKLSWMIGDGVTDAEAAVRAGIRAAYLGPRKCDHCLALSARGVDQVWFCSDLLDFAKRLSHSATETRI